MTPYEKMLNSVGMKHVLIHTAKTQRVLSIVKEI